MRTCADLEGSPQFRPEFALFAIGEYTLQSLEHFAMRSADPALSLLIRKPRLASKELVVSLL